jgi:CAAX protease family protein
MRSPSVPYVGPFIAFLVLLALSRWVALPPLAVQLGFVIAMLAVVAILTRGSVTWRDLRVTNWAGSLLLGVAVFVLWIGPDLLFPNYRHHWLFDNSLMGHVQAGLSDESHDQPAVLWLRAFRAVAIVPLIEELFWRAWLMRWLISVDFLTVPLGTYSAMAFWIVAILFASEHGSYWDVGLATGVIYNWWMLRTKSLGDLVLVHAVTNACLSLYVVLAGKWEYWA